MSDLRSCLGQPWFSELCKVKLEHTAIPGFSSLLYSTALNNLMSVLLYLYESSNTHLSLRNTVFLNPHYILIYFCKATSDIITLILV